MVLGFNLDDDMYWLGVVYGTGSKSRLSVYSMFPTAGKAYLGCTLEAAPQPPPDPPALRVPMCTFTGRQYHRPYLSGQPDSKRSNHSAQHIIGVCHVRSMKLTDVDWLEATPNTKTKTAAENTRLSEINATAGTGLLNL